MTIDFGAVDPWKWIIESQNQVAFLYEREGVYLLRFSITQKKRHQRQNISLIVD